MSGEQPASVDVSVWLLSETARIAGDRQRAKAAEAKAEGRAALGQLHTMAAGVHNHYAVALRELAQDLHHGVISRAEPSAEQLLAALDTHERLEER